MFILSSISIVVIEGNIFLLLIPFLMFLIALPIAISIFSDWNYSVISLLLPYSIGLLWISVSCYFRIYLNDNSQNEGSDAFFFYKVASANLDISLVQLVILSEGSLAIIIWEKIYKLLSSVGFGETQLFGLLVNNTLMALSCVISLKGISSFFDNDSKAIINYINIYSCCAIFWLFTSIHVRDSFIIFFTAILLYYCTIFVLRYDVKSFITLLLIAVALTLIFPFLRSEFIFIPFVFFASTLSPFFFLVKEKRDRNLRLIFLSVLMFILLSVFLYFSDYNPLETLVKGREGYMSEVQETSSSSSLGARLIVNSPLPIRIILGSIYLHIFPVPFWYGFKLDTIYDLFKSLNGIFVWFLFPFVFAALRMWSALSAKMKRFLFFNALIYIIGTLGIAMTSLETRHHAIFYLPLFNVAIISILDVNRLKNTYRRDLLVIIGFIFLVHVAWIMLKLIF